VLLCVGRIGRANGIRGDVYVEIRTDAPDERFAVGRVLATEPAERGPLQVRAARPHSGGLAVSFAGVGDRTAAEALRGTLLLVESTDLDPTDDPDEFHDTELVGLAACRSDGAALGEVTDVLHTAGGDLLVITSGDREVLVPFVRQLVPTVDVAAGRVVVDPPEGLLDL
jgi:16S rRNA processing protein RimM